MKKNFSISNFIVMLILVTAVFINGIFAFYNFKDNLNVFKSENNQKTEMSKNDNYYDVNDLANEVLIAMNEYDKLFGQVLSAEISFENDKIKINGFDFNYDEIYPDDDVKKEYKSIFKDILKRNISVYSKMPNKVDSVKIDIGKDEDSYVRFYENGYYSKVKVQIENDFAVRYYVSEEERKRLLEEDSISFEYIYANEKDNKNTNFIPDSVIQGIKKALIDYEMNVHKRIFNSDVFMPYIHIAWKRDDIKLWGDFDGNDKKDEFGNLLEKYVILPDDVRDTDYNVNATIYFGYDEYTITANVGGEEVTGTWPSYYYAYESFYNTSYYD